jgi:hypothetical protein
VPANARSGRHGRSAGSSRRSGKTTANQGMITTPSARGQEHRELVAAEELDHEVAADRGDRDKNAQDAGDQPR